MVASPAGMSSSTPSTLGRDLLIVLSLANAMAVRVWAEMLDPSTSYFLADARPWQGYIGSILVVLGLAAVGAPLAVLARRTTNRHVRRALELVFLAGIGTAIHGVRREVADLLGDPTEDGLVHQAVSAVGFAVLLLVLLPDRPRARVRKIAMTGVLVLSPFVLVTFGQTGAAAWKAADAVPDLPPRPDAERHASGPTSGTRVVIVLFDGLDQFFSFEDRSPDLVMPALDRLQDESLHYSRAIPPGTQTETVIPSLFSGRVVSRTSNAGASDRVLHYADGASELFSDSKNFFQAAGAAGHDSGLAGWFHPYCRIVGDDLAECHQRALRPEMAGMTLAQATGRQAALLLESIPHGRKIERWFFRDAVRKLVGADQIMFTPVGWHRESWEVLHRESLALASDPSLDLVFIHSPVPHPPTIWDAKTNDFLAEGRKGPYASNLALADKTLAEIRAAIEGAGLWERTALIVLSDHPHRHQKGLAATPLPSPRLKPGEPRPVPFIVRLPGKGAPAVDATPIHTTALHDLVPEILAGRIATLEQVREWFAARASS